MRSDAFGCSKEDILAEGEAKIEQEQDAGLKAPALNLNLNGKNKMPAYREERRY